MRSTILKGCLFLALTSLCPSVSANFSVIAQAQDANISGVVRDQQNVAINKANVLVLDEKDTLITSVITDEKGFFQIDNLLIGNYKLIIKHPNYREYSNNNLLFSGQGKDRLEFILTASELSEGLSITAILDPTQEAFDASQQTEYATKTELNNRPGVLLPQLLQEEPGIRLVQGGSFYGQVIIRGLTGQRVATLIDDIRFNTSTFSTALEQTVGLIDITSIRQVEFIYGPGSARYGSDALGGTINAISDNPIFYKKGWELHGSISPFFSSANAAAGGNLKLTAGNPRLSLLFDSFGQRINDLRTGQGLDSHSIVTRFFGLSSKILGNRLQDTGYLHYGSTGKIVYKIADDQQLSFFYQHTTQRNTRPYFLTNGGRGFISNNFSPQVLDFFYTRYKKQQIGFLDSLTGTFSFNRQRQQLGFQTTLAPIVLDEYRLTKAYGYGLQATAHIGSYQFLTFGGEIYDERTTNKRSRINLQLNQSIPVAGTFPNGVKYSNYGAYIQNTADLIPNKVRLNGGVRYSAFFYKTDSTKSPLDMFGNPTVPNLSIRNDDVTFNLEGIVFIKQRLNLIANVTRGFRSPNIIDLGSVGPLPSGFEVLVSDAQALGGFIGTTSDETAISTGQKVSPLRPENLLNYELGAKYQDKHVRASVTVFSGTINDFINQRTLILPPGSVGKTLGGIPIVAQNPVTGTVVTSADPRSAIIKANITDVRLYGIELNGQINFSNTLTMSGNFSYLRGKDKKPSPLKKATPSDMVIKRSIDIPDIEGGLPPATGFVSVRYQSLTKHFWVEAYSNMASFQDRLSTQDLADLRIGSTRSRNDIAFLFSNRARFLGLIGNGIDGKPATPDDILINTGETLQQIQDRVLGIGVTRAALFTTTPGYATFNLRGGFELGERSNVTMILENIFDKNYRLHGSGLDAPGINLLVRYSWRF